MMHYTDVVALIACVLGGGLGAYAMFNPSWASRLVRLVPAECKVEGQSEFRATYGGLFLLGHAFAGWALLADQPGSEMASAALAAGWVGSGIGRLISIVLDKAASPVNWFNVLFEALLGALLLTPALLK
jgi:uncharacterized membrane protein YeaQ/YmgE (transglycosylase-associated protein family)